MSASSEPRTGRRLTTDSDLARLAAGYAHRPPDEFVMQRAAAIATAAGLGPGTVVLDVGGGPGGHAVLFATTGALAVVVDPSPDMNRLARSAHPGLPVVRSGAERLPFTADAAQLIYFHLSIHHTRWRTALAEAVRVIRPGGRIEVITLGEAHHSSSLLQKWFPRIAELDEKRFPDPGLIAAALREMGGSVELSQVTQPKRRQAQEWIDAVRARFVSTLQLLDDDEIETGLANMVAATPDLADDLEYEMIWDRITASF